MTAVCRGLDKLEGLNRVEDQGAEVERHWLMPVSCLDRMISTETPTSQTGTKMNL